jgi:putative acetyltransferase
MITVAQATTTQHIEEVRVLMRAFVDWQRERYHQEIELVDSYYDPIAFESELASLPGEFAPPTGRLLLASEDDRPVGCVALHDLGDGACEMKRMFVFSEYHGRGVGQLLAKTVIEEAKQAGYKVMRLDTGARQIESLGLYGKLSFKPIAAYYNVPDILREILVFMELDLTN